MKSIIAVVLLWVGLNVTAWAQPTDPDWSTYSMSASAGLGSAGEVGRGQLFMEGPDTQRRFPAPDRLPAGARINGFDRLRNGNFLLTFDSVLTYPSGPSLFPGDIIEVTPSFNFVRFVFDALLVPGWNRTIDINAVALDETLTGTQLYFSISRSANIDGTDYRPGHVIHFNGSTYSRVFGGPGTPLVFGGYNINAIDRVLVDGTRRWFLSFEAPGHLHGHDFHSDDVVGYAAGSGFYIVDRPRDRHPAMAGQKLDALDVNWGGAPDGSNIFRDRFEVPD